MTKKERMKRAFGFTFKRAFMPGVLYSILAIVLYLFFVALSAFAREPVGHEDYMISSVFTYMGTGVMVMFVSFRMAEIHTSKYIRVSPCYKEIHTVALPFAILGVELAAVIGAVVLNIISLMIGNIDIASFNDSLIYAAAGASITALLSNIHYSGAISYFMLTAIIFFASVINPDFLRYGFGLDLTMSIIISVALMVTGFALSLVITRFTYKRRNTNAINANIRTMEAYINSGWRRT